MAALLEAEFVLRYVPVADRFFQTALKNQVALTGPDLEQEGLTIVECEDFLVNNFDEHGTEFRVLVVLAARHDLV